MTTKEVSKCCKAGLVEDTRADPQDHHNVIDIYTCEKCKLECEVDEVCEICDGTGKVSQSEQVYPGEPHMADIGEATCECSINDDDEFDNQE